jgi:hypothetical protein
VLYTRVYWGPETELDHYLVMAPIPISPRWVQKKCQIKYNKEMHFRAELLQDPSIRWLFERRVNYLTDENEEDSNKEEEWKT